MNAVNHPWLESEWVRRTFFWGCGVVAALVFYVLSIGPAAMLYHAVENAAVRDAIRTVYQPVVWLINSSELLQSFSVWYVGLWVDYG